MTGSHRRPASRKLGVWMIGSFFFGWLVFALPVWAQQASASGEAGTGTLFWNHPEGRRPLPMLKLHAELSISGIMVHGTVLQEFQNPTSETIEAIYVFPLPEQAAVHHMEIRIGQRRIVSVIQEKEEAKQTYTKARKEGRKAALLEQDRPNLFTTSVASIGPGESVQVRLEYVEELAYSNGEYGLTFPLTYTQRFGALDGRPPVTVFDDGVPLADGGEPYTPGPPDTVARLATLAGMVALGSPTGLFPAPPEATVVVKLQAGFPLEDIYSASHRLATSWDNDVLVIEAGDGGRVPADRDFLLRFRPQVGNAAASALLSEKRDDGRYALAMVLPPEDETGPMGLATKTLFIVDVSGSMAGPSITQAREALLAALDRLHPEDDFNILAFSNTVTAFSAGYLPARETELLEARHWVSRLEAAGGTRMDLALDRGLSMAGHDDDWRVERIVLLTDGAVSFDDAMINLIHRRLGAVRLHTLGIGSAPNRYLMRKMATAGRGLCDFITRVDTAENRIDAFLERLARPVLTDITLTWEGEQPLEVYPMIMPDLHSGEPLYLSARFPENSGPSRLRLEGRTAFGLVSTTMDLGNGADHPTGIATRWARAKVGTLMDLLHQGAEPAAVRTAVIDVSRQFGIVTRYTSLVAVEETPTAFGQVQTVRVPASQPGAGLLPVGGTRENLFRLLLIISGLAAMTAWSGARLLCRQRQNTGRHAR